MTEKIYYVKGEDINDHKEINMALADGWTVKLITTERVHIATASSFEKYIRGGFVIVLECK